MNERSPKDFVDSMIRRGKTWIDMVSVGRAIRHGSWYQDIISMLQERSLMPTEADKIIEAREKDRRNRVAEPSKYVLGTRKRKEEPIQSGSSDQKD